MEAPKTIDDFYVFKVKNMWAYFKGQHFSFWMICLYLFFEFVRPQALFPAIDIIPWAQLFIMGALIGAVVDPTVKHVKSIANIYVITFSILIIISVFTAYYPEVSKKKFMDFFSWVVIYFLITRIVNTKERFYIFLLIFLFAAGKIALGTAKSWAFRGFGFTSWGLMGPKGFFQNSGELSILMVMLFPLAFYLYQHFKAKAALWERLILMAFWVCPILTVLGASSRGSQLALAIVMAIMFRKSIFRIKSLIGVLILIVGLVYLLPEEQKERFRATGDDKTSQQRLLYWENGWEMMRDHPLDGVGFFNFVPYFERYYSEDMLYKKAELPHNIFIQVGTDAGFPALFLFLLLILYCIFSSLKLTKLLPLSDLSRVIAAGLGVGVLGYVIAGQFVTVAYYPFIWIHLSLIVSIVSISKSSINSQARKWSN
ncbi:O-antigen ligase family protein [Cellvibrio sp. UBA7671]|uniref:O-antigen ligase family protein n=1 Tax=Cellvibrio sp. UBA7671 TaxID=1946312 RepID=UPI002F357F5E